MKPKNLLDLLEFIGAWTFSVARLRELSRGYVSGDSGAQ